MLNPPDRRRRGTMLLSSYEFCVSESFVHGAQMRVREERLEEQLTQVSVDDELCIALEIVGLRTTRMNATC
jgi:hypothetical protein